MWKTKQINAPWADYKGNERSLSDEEYTDKDDGEQCSKDWHDVVESESIEESSSNQSRQTIHNSINTCNELGLSKFINLYIDL